MGKTKEWFTKLREEEAFVDTEYQKPKIKSKKTKTEKTRLQRLLNYLFNLK